MVQEILVAGGSLRKGHQLGDLQALGHRAPTLDAQPIEESYQHHGGAENLRLDLQDLAACRRATEGVSTVCHLAGTEKG